jgi:hypothetical protein
MIVVLYSGMYTVINPIPALPLPLKEREKSTAHSLAEAGIQAEQVPEPF